MTPFRLSRRKALFLPLLVTMLLVITGGTLLCSSLMSPGPADPTLPSTTLTRTERPPEHEEAPEHTSPAPSRGKEAGALPEGTTIFDDHHPGIANLDPALKEAARRATHDARTEGVEIYVTSGWRSKALQARLVKEAVETYGSEEEAARWAAPPEGSAHVTGEAIDVGPMTATDWLAQNGAAYGLCQIYANESWHYELRPEAVTGGCPEMYADAGEDPRMQ